MSNKVLELRAWRVVVSLVLIFSPLLSSYGISLYTSGCMESVPPLCPPDKLVAINYFYYYGFYFIVFIFMVALISLIWLIVALFSYFRSRR